MVTNDPLDFNFKPPDEMRIGPGRALLGINQSTCSGTSCMTTLGNFGAGTTLTIPIL